MDGLVTGPPECGALRFELRWQSEEACGTAAEATRGQLRLFLRDVLIWPHLGAEEGFFWTWIELVEFLAHGWPWLMWEDGLPFGISPQGRAGVAALAADRWDGLPEERREEEQRRLEAWLGSHDLAESVQGAALPSVLIAKDGLDCWVCTQHRCEKLRHDDVASSLHAVAEQIIDRLGSIDDPRAECARRDWNSRSHLDLVDRIGVATGFSPEMLMRFEDGERTQIWWQVDPDRFSLNEVMAAARMTMPLSDATIALVLDSVRNAPPRKTPELDQLAEDALRAVDTQTSQLAFDQGYDLASWLRAKRGVPDVRVDPGALLQEWGVPVVDINLGASEIDAFACWGPGHGPAVFLNPDGRHNGSDGGRRATLAHEIAHLLLDRQGALPLAEVLGGRVSPMAESRARAFAVEFLLPREISGEAFRGVSDDAAKVVERLKRRYGVSGQVVAYQVRNSGVPLSEEARRYLQGLVPEADLF